MKRGSYHEVPSRELTYPLPAGTFESMIFQISPGGICIHSLEGINLQLKYWVNVLNNIENQGRVRSFFVVEYSKLSSESGALFA